MVDNKRFEVDGKVISVPLKNGYVAKATILSTRNNNEFNITYAIASKDYPIVETIEGDVFTVKSERSASWEAYHLTTVKLQEGYFDPFIERFEFEMDAMNRGIELIERERGCNNDNI